MATFTIKGRPTFLGQKNVGDFAHTIATDYGVEPQDETVLTNTTRVMKGGLFTFGYSMDCFYDSTLEVLSFADVGGDVPLTFSTVDGTEQEIAYLINSKELISAPINGAVGDMAGLQISGNAADKLVRGVLELNASVTPKTASGNSSGIQQGAVSATEKIYASLHVITVSGSSPTLDVIVQSDDNGSFTTPVSRIVFTQATGATSEFLSTAGAITDDFWRVNFTIGGGSPSFAFAVSLGIL